MKDDIAQVRNLIYEYPGLRALDNVTVNIARGSVTALVGPNGAGKSTFLRCLAGLDQPFDGEIEVDGIDVLEHPRLCHRRIGYLSDFFGLYDALTVRQCLIHAARSQMLPDARADDAIALTAGRLGLTAKLDAAAGSLSRGQRQRVAIGQAMIHSPSLLILDEPASGLDPEARHELAELFLALRADGMTLVVSSHILAELDEYSTHMLVMRGGKIIESRPLAGSQAAPGRVRLRASVASTAVFSALTESTLRALIAGIDGVEVASLDAAAGAAVFMAPASPAARAALLAALVNGGLPVTHFAEERENLHTTYLRSIRERSAA